MKDFSPEERLLRLIRSKGNKETARPPSIEKPGEKPLKAVPAAGAVGARHAAPLQRLQLFRWRNLNLALAALSAALMAYSIPVFLKGTKNVLEAIEERLRAQETAAEKKAQGVQRPSFEHFSTALGARNIFSPVVKEEIQSPAASEEGLKLEEIKGRLTLLGIIGGEDPQAIVEDKRTQRSHFLNKGSTFEDIEVKEILENKVILTYKGREFELVL